MYDKGNNLRIEVTINNPREFKVQKENEYVKKDGETEVIKKWVPMGKSICNLYRYIEVSKSITQRYIEALPKIDTNTVALKEIKNISKGTIKKERKYSGFNILNEDTLKLFTAISRGEYLISGFYNKNIRKEIFEDADSEKNINKTTRLFAKLKAHGIIKKVYKKNKYYLTENGRKIISSVLIYTRKDLLNT